MLDFFRIADTSKNIPKNYPVIKVYPIFKISSKTKDLMIKGNDFYAAYDSNTNLWIKDEDFVIEHVDEMMDEYVREKFPNCEIPIVIEYMSDSNTGSIDSWHKYVQKQMRQNFKPLDEKLIFKNQEACRTDYVSRRMDYSLEEGDISAYEKLINVLYSPEDRLKIEWFIGSIISGDSKTNQKFCVLYGPPGSGKSTVLDIIGGLFEGVTSTFDAKDLAKNGSGFPMEAFKDGPLVSIQQDGDLSCIEDNTKLNSIVSHDLMEINEKFKGKYNIRLKTTLFMGTNTPVRITNAKSGLLRRLIDINPTGNKVSMSEYETLTREIKNEYGAIAYHCLQKYKEMGKTYYDNYIPLSMIAATNDFYDFLDYFYEELIDHDPITLKEIYELANKYCEFANVSRKFTLRYTKSELMNYYISFLDDGHIDGKHVRNIYSGFKKEKFTKHFVPVKNEVKEKAPWLIFEEQESLLDNEWKDCLAQYANGKKEIPETKWFKVTTKLKDLDTSKTHYVKGPQNYIEIDFDCKDSEGKKNMELNLKRALDFKPTYAELSKSGGGIHLHYIYDDDIEELDSLYDTDIEIKIHKGDSSLRRKLSKCNNLPIAKLKKGDLPLRRKKKMANNTVIQNEKELIAKISKALRKEIHAYTKPNIDYIKMILDEAYEQGLEYDVRSLRQHVIIFAQKSTHNAQYCLEQISKMHFNSSDECSPGKFSSDAPIAFYDVEVFKNLFVVCYKFLGESICHRLINPTPLDIGLLFQYRLVGFNNRRYDNHILYARFMGASNIELYNRSKKLINNKVNNSTFANAYNLSYTDIYDYSVKKQSLKKWEIELGIHHQECHIDWDEEVPEDRWNEVADYCENDVFATEAVWEATKGDFAARQILAAIDGLTVNHTTNTHSAKIIFGDAKDYKSEFVYTDLSTIFPGYIYDNGKSYYHDEEVGEGGYVYSVPGMYYNVWTFDVRSMHPHSAKALNIFGDRFTKRFYDLVEARVLIKQAAKKFKDNLASEAQLYLDKAGEMFDGALKPFLKPDILATLADALKIVINSVYGLTSAKFDNPFYDARNKDNIVAKRGALFMMELKYRLLEMGATVIHIKTDSIKVVDPSEEIKKFIYDFGEEYGYTFEIESIYERICLVNKAVYIAREAESMEWTATGAQFAEPYVFKTLFSKEPIEFKDMCSTFSVSTSLYLDYENDTDKEFVGKVGSFTPIKPDCNGGVLYSKRENKDGTPKFDSPSGTKGYHWLESEVASKLPVDYIDESYYISKVNDALDTIREYGDPEIFINN